MKKLMMMALAATVMFSCKDLNGGGDGNEKGDGFATFSLTFSGGSATKAPNPNPGQYGDGEEPGSDTENEMTDVTLFFFNSSTGDFGFKKTLDRSDFEASATPGSYEKVYTTKSAFKVLKGTYKVYVVVNPTKDIKDFLQNQEAFEALTYSWEPSKTIASGSFLMSNARTKITVKGSENDYITIDASNDTEDKAASFSVDVERIVAKITFTGTLDNTYDLNINSTKVGSVQFTDHALVNLRNDSYLLRRATTDEEAPTTLTDQKIKIGQLEIPSDNPNDKGSPAGNYVIDNTFLMKKSTPRVADFTAFQSKITQSSTSPTFFGGLNTGAETILTYTLENTMPANAQYNGFSTGIIFKAIIKPLHTAWAEGYNSEQEAKAQDFGDGSFYKYGEYLYNTLAALNTKTGKSIQGFQTTTPTDYSKESFADFGKRLKAEGVDFYFRGEAYYPYWIRHANNNNNTVMGIMEFAIVRNNIYKLSISSVSKIGKPTPEITPEDPDEQPDVYLKVDVRILKWVVRKNVIDF